MSELKPKIYDEANGLDYALVGDYYIPAIELPEDDDRPIGKWGRMHWAHLEKTNPLLLNHLTLTGRLHTYLADLNEQAEDEGVTEDLKRWSQWEWVKAMNSIVNRAEEIIRHELIYI